MEIPSAGDTGFLNAGIMHMNGDSYTQLRMDAFEKQYYDVRLNEQRLYTNEEIAKLPDIISTHRYYEEWNIRRRSCERLLNFLNKKSKRLNILEVGCGNGWLAAKMLGIRYANVTGIDINRLELMQAVTVFEKKEDLRFIYGDLSQSGLAPHSFDVIVFASSLQYFSSLENIIAASLQLLSQNGEIHIIDSPFYSEHETANAFKRSEAYFASLGFHGMSDYYFHHCLKELRHFKYKVLYNPSSIFNRYKKKAFPFYWITIKQKA